MKTNTTTLPPHAVRTLQAMAINRASTPSLQGVGVSDKVTLNSSPSTPPVHGRQEYLRAFAGMAR